MRGRVVLAALCGAVLAAPAGGAAPEATPGRPLATGFVLSGVSDWAVELNRARAAGARVARLSLSWPAIAPTRPATRDAARDPSTGGSRWESTDRAIRMLAARGVEPILSVYGAPDWAQGSGPRPNGGAFEPRPDPFGDFAYAAARRYSGAYQGLPRVRYWQVWNEPNLTHFLNPQYAGQRLVSPAWYRRMVNAFAVAVKSVRRDNVVVAGGLAPFECHGKPRACGSAPFKFMREFFCLSRALQPTCGERARVDAWAHHPYTSGGPTRQAYRRDDASLGDLPEMKRVLDAAYRHRRIAAPRRPQFWVTEFSWDTKPPRRHAAPIGLAARWTAEALYQMWRSGVSLVTWFGLEDKGGKSPYQSGLYFHARSLDRARAKPVRTAFRFPFVAYLGRGTVDVWGRDATSNKQTVTIQRRAGIHGHWRTVARVRANRSGIFRAKIKLAAKTAHWLRAVAPGSGNSLAFSLKRPSSKLRYGPWGN
jgi:hypothetical protein